MYRSAQFFLASLSLTFLVCSSASAEVSLGKAYRFDAQTAQQRATASAAPTLTDAEKTEFLRLVNNARSTARTCGTQSFPAASPVQWKPQLESAAQRHSNDMASHNIFSHTGSDGSSPSDRINATGYLWSFFGENIAAGYSTPQTVIAAWLKSPGHCANIMDSRVQDIGAAKAVNPASRFGTYWTLDGAHPR